MKIEGSGRSARRFRALDDINILYRDTRNVGKVGIHSRPDLRITLISLDVMGGWDSANDICEDELPSIK